VAGSGRNFPLLQGLDALAWAVLALGLAAAAVMLATLFATVVSVDVANGSCEVINDANPELAERCSLSGVERHSVLFLVLALPVAVMAVGAGPGRSRPAAVALVALGLLALFVALLSDLPASDETGALGRNFEGATAAAGTGLTLEIAGGVLAVAAGALGLLRPS
jgi:hypothetical protein